MPSCLHHGARYATTLCGGRQAVSQLSCILEGGKQAAGISLPSTTAHGGSCHLAPDWAHQLPAQHSGRHAPDSSMPCSIRTTAPALARRQGSPFQQAWMTPATAAGTSGGSGGRQPPATCTGRASMGLQQADCPGSLCPGSTFMSCSCCLGPATHLGGKDLQRVSCTGAAEQHIEA